MVYSKIFHSGLHTTADHKWLPDQIPSIHGLDDWGLKCLFTLKRGRSKCDKKYKRQEKSIRHCLLVDHVTKTRWFPLMAAKIKKTLITHKTCRLHWWPQWGKNAPTSYGLLHEVVRRRCPLWVLMSFCRQVSWLGRATPPWCCWSQWGTWWDDRYPSPNRQSVAVRIPVLCRRSHQWTWLHHHLRLWPKKEHKLLTCTKSQRYTTVRSLNL